MKNRSLLILMMLCLACIVPAKAETIEIGDGGTVNNQYLPGYNYYNYSLSQQIYTADEIGMAGTITSIAFKNTGTEKTRLYHVYMLMTDKEAFTNNTDWVAMSEDDLVFSGELTFAVDVWTTIELNTPFTYSGDSNLLVGVADVTGSYSTSPHMACLVFGAENQSIRAYTDGAAYDITAPNVSGTMMNVKNQIQLEITPAGGTVCIRPTLEVSNITSSGATLNWTGGSGTYNVQLFKNGSWNTILTNSTATSTTLSSLSPLTAYQARIQSVCEGGATSDWRTVSFNTTAVATAVGNGWSDDFEGSTCGWELKNNETGNAWAWGVATNHSGTHAIYITNDGGTSNTYNVSSQSMVYATKLLSFNTGKYEFTYNWNCNGEKNYDYLRVALVPASVSLAASTSILSGFGSTNLPADWIALDDGSQLSAVTGWQNKTVSVEVEAGNYYLVLAWRNDNSVGNQPPAAIDNVSIAPVTCEYEVDGLTANNITAQTATLSWNAGEARQWQIAYSSNSSLEDATEVIVNEATYDMTGLEAATMYYVKVRTCCGDSDFGSWCPVFSFYTECSPLSSYPYTENFEGFTAGIGVMPVCWNRINTSSYSSYSEYPRLYNYGSHSNPNCLYFYSTYNSTYDYDPQDQYAILPEMEDLAGKQISFYAKGNSNLVSIKIGTITDPTDASTFTVMATEALTTDYQEIVCVVPADATASHIALMMEAANPSSNTRYVYIDDIVIEDASCPKPTRLALTDNSVTAHGATITWSENGDATSWIVEYSNNSDFGYAILNTAQNEPTYTFHDLFPSALYYVRVKADCGDGSQSLYSNTISFGTAEPCPNPSGLTVTDITGNSATLNWSGANEGYNVMYRTAAQTTGFFEPFSTNAIPTGWMKCGGLLEEVLAGTTTLGLVTNGWSTSATALGAYHMKVNIYGTNCKHWLVTPEVTINNNYNLVFDLALTDYNYATPIENPTAQDDDRFVILIYANDHWTILREWNNTGSDYVFNTIATTGENVSINLAAYVGQNVKIAFYAESTVSNNGDNDLHIDNVGIGVPVPAGAWQTIVSDEPSVQLLGLAPETTYEAKVQGNCGDDGMSLETDIVSFTTLELTTITQTLPLSTGTNWVSFNVETTLDDLKAALVDALPGATSINIRSQNNGYSTYNGTRWRGSLSSIDLTQMYMITVTTACEIALEGMSIDPAGLPITIKNGNNWITFPLSTAMSPADAFANFNVANGDVIRSQNNGISTYTNRWRGSLSTLEPGQGYMFKSATTNNRTLVFPTSAK